MRRSCPRFYALTGLQPHGGGNAGHVIGLALALVVVGVVFLFLIPWVGIPVGLVGLVLLVVWLLGFGRRAAAGRAPPAVGLSKLGGQMARPRFLRRDADPSEPRPVAVRRPAPGVLRRERR